MAYRANPFLQRMSEQTTSDQEFAQMFSPKLLDLIDEQAFEGAVHIFRSPRVVEKRHSCGRSLLLPCGLFGIHPILMK